PARGASGRLVIAAPQPAPKPFAADGPGFSVAVDQVIGKCGAGGGVKQPLAERHVHEHIERSLARRLAVHGRSVGFCRSIGTGTLRRGLGLNPSLVDAGVLPELTGNLDRIDASLLPPGFFIAAAMHRAVMRAAEWDGKFITCFAAERARLHKSDVMRVRGLAAAQQARLPHHKAKVVPVAIAARRRHREHALIDADLMNIRLANLLSTSAETFRTIDSAFGRQELG